MGRTCYGNPPKTENPITVDHVLIKSKPKEQYNVNFTQPVPDFIENSSYQIMKMHERQNNGDFYVPIVSNLREFKKHANPLGYHPKKSFANV